jgi:hypothetical protein
MLSGGLRVAGLRFPESLIVDKGEEVDRLEEGDIMVLERQLEDNLLKGTSRYRRVANLVNMKFVWSYFLQYIVRYLR